MEAEGGTVEGPVGWSFQSLSRKNETVRWQHRDESGRGFELQRKKNWKNEEEECVSVFWKRKQKEGYYNNSM